MEKTRCTKCECGAYTVEVEEKSYSVMAANLTKYFSPEEAKEINQMASKEPETYCCNHCVNHWGIDLCGCGSGEPFGECEENTRYCELAMQEIGERTCVVATGSFMYDFLTQNKG